MKWWPFIRKSKIRALIEWKREKGAYHIACEPKSWTIPDDNLMVSVKELKKYLN